MEQDESSSAPRKLKFAPKAPPRRKPKPTPPKTEVGDDEEEEAEHAQSLLRRFNENLARRGPKDEKKSSVQVAFGPGVTPSALIRKFGVSKDGIGGKSSGSCPKSSDYGKALLSSPSAANEDGRDVCSADPTSTVQIVKKEYREPWDYHNTYYPTTIPLRRPYAGDPELLDEAEFGEAAANSEYDENTISPASDLGLMAENEEEKMFFFKLPASLPLLKRSTSRKGKEKVETDSSLDSGGVSKKGCSLEELPGGYLGKMLVYKSGAIKLKLGNTLYDVTPGSDCVFAQDVAAINLAEKQCCVLGELGKRAVVTLDVDSLLDGVINLG
ncbi:uncharacterized protein LOC121234238 [Juglans microcarpa x Juglans regia]|uniref:uncharacterized protein LOC121234238 n=1 Tax=Juglans microcarpa x Juglans regia TaxID=2249226 RepID=UPI001B7E6B8A|nr:uncharacterized protein LOC121234238 [Juglans microcarpa x Juglans regia]